MARRRKGYVKAVIGTQWGDEGKGKIVDFLAKDAHIVVRYAGGGNAGHTVINDRGEFKARIIPVGIFNQYTELNIIGRGTVPALDLVVQELKVLEEKNIEFRDRLKIDFAAHLVMPWHIAEDRLEEEARGDQKIGTTGSGIGPCYADKIKRVGFRAGDLFNTNQFRQRFIEMWRNKFEYLLRNYNAHFSDCIGCPYCELIRFSPYDEFAKIVNQLDYLAQKFQYLENLICETSPILWEAIDSGKKILLEGAQGALLDIDGGTYPYVTSSNTGAASAAQGSGIAPSDITHVIGVLKAYTTRVGSGPFPTRADFETEEKLRYLGKEYGAVTGRPRLCGWNDENMLRVVARMNKITAVAITRLDVLDNFEKVGIGVGYIHNCYESDYGWCKNPYHALRDPHVESSFVEYMPGWGISTNSCREWDALPKDAQNFCKRIACGIPIKYISVGAKREETIVL